MSRVVRIERVTSRKGGQEEPHLTTRGYQLADPAHGSAKHHAEHAVYVRDLDAAADLIEKGFSIWMRQAGKRASLIGPSSVRIVRA